MMLPEMIGQALGNFDERLNGMIIEIDEQESAESFRAVLLKKWSTRTTSPEEQFLELNLKRAQGPLELADVVEMAIAAREGAARRCDDPADALVWLLSAVNCLGYMEALIVTAARSEQKKQAAKKNRSSKQAQIIQDDVLSYIEQHQPPEGWDREQAIKAYVGQPFEKTSEDVQAQGYDEYWVNIDQKLKGWLRNKREFSKAFHDRLRQQVKPS